MKRRLTAALLALGMTFSLAACTGDNGSGGGSAGEQVFRRLYTSEVASLNYLYTGNTTDLEMASNTVDGLVEYDNLGNIAPSLAEKWESNEDHTVWTFHIRPGVKWVDYQGNEVADVTAHDWVTAAKWSNDAKNESSTQYMYDGIVKNAQAYYDYTAYLLEIEGAVDGKDDQGNTVKINQDNEIIQPVEEVKFEDVGVKALDDLTLEYTMESPCPFFPSVLSYASYMPVYAPFLEEKGDQFGAATGPDTILYNGAFLMSEFEPQYKRILVKNPTYWDKDKVYLERVEYMYNTTATTLAPEQFLRGEVDWAQLDASLLSAWLTDETKRPMVSPSRPNVDYSYFYSFNFEPRFDASLQPENWILAVNNENFRQSILAAMDRVNALMVQDPQNPKGLLNNTITPANFAMANGQDYTQYPGLKEITERDSFQEAAALDYKAKAVEELTAAGATFPVKVYMRYNPDTANWDKECQVIEQQLEAVLGTDYIDVIVEAGPSTGFLGAVRRAGDYGLMKCNWGADYADPQTWTVPFDRKNTYNFMEQDPDRSVAEKSCDHKSPETQALVAEYYELLDAAKAINNDDAARYAAFAQAEAFLINHALVIPFSISTDGYVATRLNIFEAQYAPYGLARQRYKGQKLMEEPMNMEQFNELLAQWESERAALSQE